MPVDHNLSLLLVNTSRLTFICSDLHLDAGLLRESYCYVIWHAPPKPKLYDCLELYKLQGFAVYKPFF